MSGDPAGGAHSWRREYAELISAGGTQPGPVLQERARQLGRRLAGAGVSPEELAAGHVAALRTGAGRRRPADDGLLERAAATLAGLLAGYTARGGSPPAGADAQVAAGETNAPAALSEQEALFRQLAESIREAFWLSDVRTERALYVNPAVAQLWGLPLEVFRTRPGAWLEQVHPDDRARLLADMERQRRGEPTEHEYRCVRPDGSIRWIRTRAFPVRNAAGDVYRVAGVSEDVTERRQTEQELRKFKAISDQAAYGAAIADHDGVLLYVNAAFAEMHGYAPAELVGRHLSVFHAPEQMPRVRALNDALKTTGSFVAEEVWHVRRDGRVFPTLMNAGLIAQPHEPTPLLAATAIDISDRKAAEEATRRHLDQLAHVSRVSVVGEMASGLAHELAQPISAILYYARSCHSRLRRGTWGAAEAVKATAKIAAQAERAGEFIRSLKAFVRTSQPRRAPAAINDVVRAAVELAAPELRAAGVSARLDLPDGLPDVVIDRIQIEQVILNLVRNALDALADTPPGDRALHVQAGRAPEGGVCVTVRDTGRGLPPEAAAHAFDPFFSTKPDGLGLGLSISRTIVAAHDGTLWFEPAERGTAFRFRLPAAREGRDGRE